MMMVFVSLVTLAAIVVCIRAERTNREIRDTVVRVKNVLQIIEAQHRTTEVMTERVVDRMVQEVRDVKRDTVRAAEAADAVKAAITGTGPSAHDSGKLPVVKSPGE